MTVGCLYVLQLSKKYGSVFTIYFGPKKVVVLVGYKTVKQALVNHAEEFGDRDITPLFHDLNKGHGKTDHRVFICTNMADCTTLLLCVIWV